MHIDTVSDNRRTLGQSAYILNYEQVAALIARVSLRQFAAELSQALIDVYQDRDLQSLIRMGWTVMPDTLELMGCETRDLTCAKLIASNPTLIGGHVPTVIGTIFCTKRPTDEMRLICDAGILTPLRTAVSTAVVANRVASSVESVAIIGAGSVGLFHGFALSALLDNVQYVVFCDKVDGRAEAAAQTLRCLLAREAQDLVVNVTSIDYEQIDHVYECEVIVTATYGDCILIDDKPPHELADGTFIAAVGADLPGKRELGFSVYDSAKFIADDLAQCLREGELQHIVERYSLSLADTGIDHRGSILGGRIVSVTDLLDNYQAFSKQTERLTVYDSTGFSGQDLATARVLLRLLEQEGWPSTTWNPPDQQAPFRALMAANRTDTNAATAK